MSKIFNFENLKLSDRNGIYGGTSCKKEGVIIDNEYWLIKYPQDVRNNNTLDVSYTTSPLSEYIGSQIYKILGFDVHETALGIRHDRVVVACKDFCEFPGELREIRTLKNIYDENLENDLELDKILDFAENGSSHIIQLKELLAHFKYNPVLAKVAGVEERFWNCLVVDALINNNERNIDDWGLILKNGSYELAPIFDNGSSFFNKLSDEQIEKLINNRDEFEKKSLNIITSYGDKHNHFDFKYFLLQENLIGLDKSIKKLVPIIVERFSKIERLISDIPEEYNGISICSSVRKRFYIECMKLRINEVFVPTYKKLNDEKYYE